MKPELKRIEAALQHASNQYAAPPHAEDHLSWKPTSVDALASLKTDLLESNPSAFAIAPALARGLAASDQPASLASSHLDLPQFRSQENGRFVALTNSALSINLLKDFQTMVAHWTAALENVMQQMEALYEEGPIVKGWLESFNPDQPSDTAYRLCGLDEDGQLWQRPCPQEQVPDVSLAIVRYQRLQTLLSQKQSLEAKLSTLTEVLMDVHGKVGDASE